MNGELILVRHGKAESKELDKPDGSRKLTEKGVQEFTDFMPRLTPLLKDKQLKIWTSPMVRAKETAKILTKALDHGPAIEKNFLENGDLTALLQVLDNEADGFSVICVGHEPSLSAWVKELTGTTTPFPKGAVFAIQFSDSEAKIDWKLSPKNEF